MVVGEGALAGEHLIHLGLDRELLENPHLVADLRRRLGGLVDLLGAIDVALAERLRRLPLRPLGALEAELGDDLGSSVRPAAWSPGTALT
jgi:hypothetical protein